MSKAHKKAEWKFAGFHSALFCDYYVVILFSSCKGDSFDEVAVKESV